MDKTLLKGLQVLQFVARSDRSVRIGDVATELGLTRSNAFRVLRTLESAGFLKQDPRTKEFTSSFVLWELGTLVVNRMNLRALAADALRWLADMSRESIHLAVLDGEDVVYVEKIDSPEPVSAYTRLGGRAPAYCVATGKALLSQLSEAELAPHLANLTPHSKFTITDPVALRADLERTKVNGYAINRGEWRDSVWGIASVVRNATGAAVAAVGVSGPSFRIEGDARCLELAGMVQTAAHNISKNLN